MDWGIENVGLNIEHRTSNIQRRMGSEFTIQDAG